MVPPAGAGRHRSGKTATTCGRYGDRMGRDQVRGLSGSVALGRARADRWLPTPTITTIDEAAAFVDGVGFAVLFPADHVESPSLWEAVAGPDPVPFADGMGPAESHVWTWKDELPKAGLAWYGKLVYKRASLLSPRLLAALYEGDGKPTDHVAFDVPDAAHRIADALMSGPLPTAALREIVGDRRHYTTAISALQRHLLVTSAGVRAHPTGWPAAVVDLTCRLFEVGGGLNYTYATRRFLDTMIEATPSQLARTYGWPVDTARAQLDALAG
jgi:hypothetical protein